MIDIIAEVPDKLIQEWRPNDRQADALAVPDSFFELLYGGAAGGGKTDYLLMLPIVRRFYMHPLFHGIIFRRTYPELERSVIQRALRDDRYGALVNAGYCTYNASKHEFKFKPPTGGSAFNGATIRFGYMDLDANARDHKSAEYHYVGIDEASEFTPYMLTYIGTRIRSSCKDLPAIYRLGSNPGGPAHVYLKERFVEPCPQGYARLYDGVTKTSRIFIPAKVSDNPALAESDPNYVNRLAILKTTNEAEYKALTEGDWFIFSGQVFSEFRDVQRPGEPENALHVVEPFPIPDYWPKILSIDWGFDANIVCHVAAITPDNRVVVFLEYVNNRALVSTWASDIARLVQHIPNLKQPCELDPSAWLERGEDKTIHQLAEQYSKLKFRKAVNDRIQGKLLAHEHMRWTKKPPRYVPAEGYNKDTAERILRMNGMEAYEEYMRLFQPEKEEKNLPKLLIFSTCRNLINTIPKCQYEDRNKYGKSAEDVKEFDGDDAYDNLRYLLFGTRRYYEEAGRGEEQYLKQSVAVEKLKEDNDYNAYVFRMRQLESETRRKDTPVMRRARFGNARFH